MRYSMALVNYMYRAQVINVKLYAVVLYALRSFDQYGSCFSSSDDSSGRGTSPGTANKQAAKNSGNANRGYHSASSFCRSLKEVNVARRYACRIRRRNKIGQRT